MKIDGIYSMRGATDSPSYDLVYEWEDEIAQALNVPLLNIKSNRIKYGAYAARLFNCDLTRDLVFGSNKRFLRYVMYALDDFPLFNHRSCVPVIIDFFVSPEKIPNFINIYRRCADVCVTSRQVYDILSQYDLPFRLHHLPLSLSSKFAVDKGTVFEKNYDLVLFGRQNNDMVVKGWIDEYCREHPDFVYVYQDNADMNTKAGFVYKTNKDEIVGPTSTREQYLDLVKKTRVAIYSTPAKGGRPFNNGYDQVTPKLLEFINFQCHVILRYSDNPDTRYFKLKSLGDSVESYPMFKTALDNALSQNPDYEACRLYMSDYNTKNIINILNNI